MYLTHEDVVTKLLSDREILSNIKYDKNNSNYKKSYDLNSFLNNEKNNNRYVFIK